MPRSSQKQSQLQQQQQSPLWVIVLDVSPVSWGPRELQRAASDARRAGKRSIGPGTLSDCVTALLALLAAHAATCSSSSSAVVVIGVAHQHVATLVPRRDEDWQNLTTAANGGAASLDGRAVQRDLVEGIHELVSRCVADDGNGSNSTATGGGASSNSDSTQACMAAGFSLALCVIHRLVRAAKAQASAKATIASQAGGLAWLDDDDDDDDNDKDKGRGGDKNDAQSAGGWAPRIFLVQASPDRSRDYNAFMNCTFGAIQQGVVVDACYFKPTTTTNSSSGGNTNPNAGANNNNSASTNNDAAAASSSSSALLEQTVDLTNGVFLSPSGAAQVGGALTEVWQSVFLPPPNTRHTNILMPGLQQVDFRARAFDTHQLVDQAYVCNQCLSIFQNKPTTIRTNNDTGTDAMDEDGANAGHHCPTCDAEIRTIS